MLTRRQEAFVNEYLIDLNGTKAAIRAGYAPGSAGVEANRLLKQPDIAAAVGSSIAQRAVRTEMDQDRVIDELGHLAFSNVNHFEIDDDTGDLVLRDGAPCGALAAVQSVRHRKRVHVEKNGAVVTTHDSDIRLWNKVAALHLLGRHVGLFSERMEHSGPNGAPIERVTKIERVILPDLPSGALAQPLDTE